MNAFISYSHADSKWLDIFHKHLTQLRRDDILSQWTDEQILAGQKFERKISVSLERSNIFIALLSPDYIASNYCYEIEFEKAIALEKAGKIIILPVILEPCDWLNTPFREFKALPKDGKAVSTWENQNTAFLDIIQNLRKLLTRTKTAESVGREVLPTVTLAPKNYRVQRDFDTIEKMEFAEKSFHEIKEFLKRYMEEIVQIDNIKARILKDEGAIFECILVNRNKINAEAQLTINLEKERSGNRSFTQAGTMSIGYSMNGGSKSAQKIFGLSNDAYHLMWSEFNFFSSGRQGSEFTSKNIADAIWSEWLESVGII